MAIRLHFLIYSLLALQIASNLGLVSATTYDYQPTLEPLTTRGVTLKGGEIIVIPLSFTRDGNLIVSATQCEGDATEYALTQQFDMKTAEKNLLSWTKIGDSITKTSQRVILKDDTIGEAYLLVKLVKVIDAESFSSVQFRTSLVNSTISPDTVFSVPKDVQIEWKWDSELNKLVGTWPMLDTKTTEYEEMLDQTRSSEKLSVTYEMIATVSKGFTEGMAKCNKMVKAHTGEVRAAQEIKLPSEKATVAFDLEPKENIYYFTLVATVAKSTWNNSSKKSWEVQYIYPTIKYEVPVQYLPGAATPSKPEDTVKVEKVTEPEVTSTLNKTENPTETSTTEQSQTQVNSTTENKTSANTTTEEANVNTSIVEPDVAEPTSTEGVSNSTTEGTVSDETSTNETVETPAKTEETAKTKSESQKHGFSTTSMLFLIVVGVVCLVVFVKMRQNRNNEQPKPRQKSRNIDFDMEDSSSYFELSSKRNRIRG
eukprot:CAMPEP_0176475236 /NCGR_PEP_ID=MMETSP0127-20121128/43494_1 /TAXON_ID=938130 /ORGANISM="Platyophrya macrostoma, Strain WH" /LENGTH=482 /DNA_ID=CAMNT_0017870809 /DNA_START=20 /DNA_END=1468 /DNA_ORIENTATION=-